MTLKNILLTDIIVDEYFDCSGETLSEYAYGYCHLFAIALAEILDYKIEAYWVTDRNGWGRSLVHSYTTDGETKFDAHGVLLEEILNEYKEGEEVTEGNEIYLKKYDSINEFKKDIAKFYENDKEEYYGDKNRIEIAKKFIKKHKNYFKREEVKI